MDKLKKLEAEFKANTKECLRLRNEIEKLKLEKELPSLKSKYEGKFWKYRNSIGGDEKWWLYSYCRKCKDDMVGLFDSFQTTIYQSEFKYNREDYYHLCQYEISKDEYLSAYNDFKANMEIMDVF